MINGFTDIMQKSGTLCQTDICTNLCSQKP